MRQSFLPAVGLSVAALALTAFAGSATAQTSGPAASFSGGAVATQSGVAAKGCFSNVDPSGDTGTAITSQDFLGSQPVESWAADDFSCKKATKIKTVSVVGQYYNGSGPADSVNVTVYADKKGEPNDKKVVCDFTEQKYTGGASFNIKLDGKACKLAAKKTYWLSVQANMDFGVGGQWGWENTSVAAGEPADWKEDGGFGTGCTAFQNGMSMQECLAGVAPGPDFMFSVK